MPERVTMPAVRGVLCIAWAALACASCLEGQSADWPKTELAVHFLVRLDSTGRAVEWTPARTSYEPLTSTLEAGGAWVLLGIPEDRLSRVDPWFDPRDAAQLELQETIEDFGDCRGTGRVVRDRFEQALDDSEEGWLEAWVFRGSGSGFESVRIEEISHDLPLDGQLLLSGPVGPSSCERSHRLESRPFGANSPLFEEVVVRGRPRRVEDSLRYFSFESAVPIDRDRALVISQGMAFIATRGGGAPAADALVDFELLPPPAESMLWNGTGIDVAPGGRIALVTLRPNDESGARPAGGAALVMLHIEGGRLSAGPFRLLLPATPTEERHLNAIAFGPDGSYVAGGGELVVTGSSAEALPQLHDLLNGDIREVIFSDDPDQPHVLADARNGFFVGDARLDRLNLVDIAVGEDPSIRAATKLSSGKVVGGNATGAVLGLQLRGTQTESSRFSLPPEAEVCGALQCGRPTTSERIWGISALGATGRDWLAMSVDSCANVFALELETNCALATRMSFATDDRLGLIEGVQSNVRRMRGRDGAALQTGIPALLEELRLVELE